VTGAVAVPPCWWRPSLARGSRRAGTPLTFSVAAIRRHVHVESCGRMRTGLGGGPQRSRRAAGGCRRRPRRLPPVSADVEGSTARTSPFHPQPAGRPPPGGPRRPSHPRVAARHPAAAAAGHWAGAGQPAKHRQGGPCLFVAVPKRRWRGTTPTTTVRSKNEKKKNEKKNAHHPTTARRAAPPRATSVGTTPLRPRRA